MNREDTNRILRNTFTDILNYKPTGKELARKKEIEKILRKEKEEYDKKKIEFYDNPLHWDNNKRRRYGLPVLRGRINKCRTKRYPSFRPTPKVMFIIEDMIDEMLTDKHRSDKFFEKFVDIKDMAVGDANVFYVSNW